VRSSHLTLGRRALVVLAGLGLLTLFQPGTALAAKSAKAKSVSAAPGPHLLAHLTGAQETPPNSSTATGSGSVTLSADQTTITVNLSFTGLAANASAAHIHGPAAPGVPAGVIFPLAGVPAATAGSIPQQTFPVTPAQVGQLLAGLWYFNVHDVPTFGSGEIRGQIVVAEDFSANLTGSQETPPNASSATGSGSVALSADQTSITVDLSFSGLTTPASKAHIHGPAVVGVPTGVVFPLAGVPAATSGSIPEQSFPITPAQVAQLRSGLFYLNVHSATFPGGEIRGQLLLAKDFQGIRMVTAFDQVVAFGHASVVGATLGNLNAPIVGISDTPDYQGYWLAGADGGVFSFGEAGFFGSLGAIHLNAPIVGMAHTVTGLGYWLVAADGGVFAFCDAAFLGSLGALHLNAPIVGMAPTPDNKGYWLVGADGGVFAFGDAGFFGSLGATRLNAAIVGITSTLDGKGYRMVGADGGVFAFGDAVFFGSAGALHLDAPVVGIARTPDDQGYWLAGADGGVFTYGDATFLGSVPGSGQMVKLPVVGVVATGTG
jgi:hypothetical protein